MSAVKGRSRRHGAHPVPTMLLQGRVSVEAHTAAKAAADAAGISMSTYLEAVVLADAEAHLVSQAGTFHQEALTA